MCPHPDRPDLQVGTLPCHQGRHERRHTACTCLGGGPSNLIGYMKPQLENQILARLNDAEHARLAPSLERITLQRDALLAEPWTPLRFAYFPTGCVLSSIVVLKDGTGVEAATVGNEGMVYVGIASQQLKSPYRIIPQISGDCLRVPVETLQNALRELPELTGLIHRYTLALHLQSSQNAACNLRHDIKQRLSRWLLVSADRSSSDELDLTQESLSIMLGVRRQSVNVTVGLLQREGLIAIRRGAIKIVDRPRLEAAACECYRTTAAMYDHVMSA